MSITLERYLGQHIDEAAPDELTNEIILRAVLLIERVRRLLQAFGEQRVQTSGWRPLRTNVRIPGAAPNSAHLSGEAIDLEDLDGRLFEFCRANKPLLIALDIYIEQREQKDERCHIQIRKTASGNRIFQK